MITTSTPTLHLPEKQESPKRDQTPADDFPSDRTLAMILNFSRNLEVKKSKLVTEIEFVKS